MMTKFPFPGLSWVAVLGTAALFTWLTVSPFGGAGIPIVAGFLACVAIALVRLGRRAPVALWEDTSPSGQVGKILLLVVTAATIQFVADVALTRYGNLDLLTSRASYLVIWTIVPLAFVLSGTIRLPRRRASIGAKELVVVGGIAVALAIALCALQLANLQSSPEAPSAGALAAGGTMILLGASAEEAVYRILLLTALVRSSGSRLQAVILSSAVFALVHIPPALSIPLGTLDWPMLQFYLTQFLPELVWILGMGWVFGAIWLRTGSVFLVILVHVICNISPVLANGLQGL